MDEEKLISKKEVLEKLGISYGQLYRWKRKGLIPEDWFIRRATFTGQETFFPQEKIISRIERIKEMKETHPLDDLADLITARVNDKLEVAFSRLRNLGWLDDEVIRVCHLGDDQSMLSLQETLCVGVLRQLEEKARKEEIDLAKQTIDQSVAAGLIERIREEHLLLYLLRKRLSAAGISAEISMVAISSRGAVFDPETEVVQLVDLQMLLERIKLDCFKEKGCVEEEKQGRAERERERIEEEQERLAEEREHLAEEEQEQAEREQERMAEEREEAKEEE
ncbi:MAG: DUF4004 family protein [Candidatus Bipolaricaulota bacterium]|nr:DUF4004 family protein [Candidatus Bipolaricaulota bacterium]